MDESIKDSILQEFHSRVAPLIEGTSIFINDSSFTEREKQSLNRIYQSFSTSAKFVESTISENQSFDDILQAGVDMENVFTHFVNRLNSFLKKHSEYSEFPILITKIQSRIHRAVKFLAKTFYQIQDNQNQNHESQNQNHESQNQNHEWKGKKPNLERISEPKHENANSEINSQNDKQNNQSENMPQKKHRRRKTSPNDVTNHYEASFDDSSPSKAIKSPKKSLNKTGEAEENQKTEKTKSPKKINNKNDNLSNSFQNSNELIQNESNTDHSTTLSHQRAILNIVTSKNVKGIDSQTMNESPISFNKQVTPEIKNAQNELNLCTQRVNSLLERYNKLKEQQKYWTETQVTAKIDNVDDEILKLLTNQAQILNSRIKSLDNANNLISFQIDEKNHISNQKARILKNQENDIYKQVDDFVEKTKETRMEKSNLDKRFFDLNLKIHEMKKDLKKDKKEVEERMNKIAEMIEMSGNLKTSNSELQKKLNFYDTESNSLQEKINSMKKKNADPFNELYQELQDSEIELYKSQQEYQELVQTKIPDLNYQLSKITKEVSHLGLMNKKEQEEAEIVRLEILKNQLEELFMF
ncbi:hypothetical protein TRFO_21113 [Tritrichomonas foetus]|uniref:Uncharacterized protein n=1 Tax=Tritrichomonas foetus TaxID=1144522 RepID=A0A1J4KFW2_9EUKA|nr:hypothetical protein TRFO_21113 [Tritrichomonas foetus]|eukprot:OHT09832.1 hypothetical protein TRFO_21113 [Tritrichomonas foetus]